MTKQFLILLFLFMLGTVARGQTTKTIEVLVTDTILVEGKEFHYSFFISTQEFRDMLPHDLYDEDMRIIETEKLLRLIKQEKIEIVEKETTLLQVTSRGMGGDIVSVKFQSKDSMVKFLKGLGGYANLQGFMTGIEVGDLDEHEGRLDKRLISEGYEKAKRIASYINKDIGDIAELSEVTPLGSGHGIGGHTLNDSIGWTAYPLHALLEEMGGGNSNTLLTFSKTLRLKFELK